MDQPAATPTTPAPSRHRLSSEVLRFGVVGMAGFVADVGGFNLLRFVGGHGPFYEYPLSAKVVSSTLGIVVAWLGNRYWTYAHRRRTKVHHELLAFVLTCLVGIGISVGCLWISHYGLGLRSPLADNIATNLVGLGLATAFRFWAYRTIVFNDGGREERLDQQGQQGQDVVRTEVSAPR